MLRLIYNTKVFRCSSKSVGRGFGDKALKKELILDTLTLLFILQVLHFRTYDFKFSEVCTRRKDTLFYQVVNFSCCLTEIDMFFCERKLNFFGGILRISMSFEFPIMQPISSYCFALQKLNGENPKWCNSYFFLRWRTF